ncbi:MAG: glycosyltransferase family 4 protein [Solirubrobacteraceae bacterium]
MRILIFHGYLLGGTGSNVYNARLAEALMRLGHKVHLFSQDRHPESCPFVDAVGSWEHGSLQVRRLADRPVRCTVYRPDIGGLLPVYVADRYEGVQARTFLECDEKQIDAYVHANVDAVREVVERVGFDIALANHLVMGPAILARALAGTVPYAVKVHGSALEYTVKRDPQRFSGFAREGLAGASCILVGSRHTAESLWEALGDPALGARTRLGPPGVDVQRFLPREPALAHAALHELADRLTAVAADGPVGQTSTFARDERTAAAAVRRVASGEGPLVAFVGKLIVSKGVDLLLAAWPLVLERSPDARLAIVGFGAYRDGLLRLCEALGRGDIQEAREIALAGRALEREVVGSGENGEERSPLRHLLAFLDSLEGPERDAYLAAASSLGERAIFTGRLDHQELVDLLPACDAFVVPSTFPEAFGMVAAEAAACGVPPVSARHSGLAEVSDVLAGALPAKVGDWLSFPVDDSAVRAIAERVIAWLGAPALLRAECRARLVETVRERWSWEGVGRGVIAAALGELEGLDVPR